MKKKPFSRSAAHHIYIRCKDKGVLFYTLEDRLVYYTLASSAARKYRVTVVAASLMFTHLHQSLLAETEGSLSSYLRSTGTSFARLYNFRYGREGQLFDRPVGHSQKYTGKEKRTNVIYVFNNHVEKGLCSEAVKERWSFLAYALSCHPFSEAVDAKRASGTLKRAIRLVDRRILRNKGLEYVDLDRILPHLCPKEREQFVDYVISRYSWIDYSKTVSMFGSVDSMITAINSTTGSEYDIKEEFIRERDSGYVSMIDFASRHGFLERIFTMSGEEKMGWRFRTRYELDADDFPVKRFLHCL